MTLKLNTFDLIRMRRAALNRYSLQSAFLHRMTDPQEQRVSWAHQAASNINTVRASGNDGAPPVAAGRLHAITLLSEAYLRVLASYRDLVKADFIERSIVGMVAGMGHEQFYRVCTVFLHNFPTSQLLHNVISAREYLEYKDAGVDHMDVSFQSMIITWLHSINPAVAEYKEMFELKEVAEHSPWEIWLESVEQHWDNLPPFGPDNIPLFKLLQQPMKEAPDSLEDQLRFIALRWHSILGTFAESLLMGADMIREESRPVFSGPGPAFVPTYCADESEPEAYSSDIDWMPSVVLLAKNTYVWLEQLTREYGFTIDRLDLVPEDALIKISRRGFTGLWLIGLWSRSPASCRIKQMCGNPEAVASAYSIYDYSISDDLGGEEAFRIFRGRAAAYGIRLAGDMVPNHMGIDSWWVCNHPEWFISTPHCPFPQYSFNGPDLSSDPRCSIYLEDHYYSRSDAAVVFKHIDHSDHCIRYIYHGNDGTGLPWNDTAQLDFLQPAVREQVIKTIIDVAGKFPIIRFDAAMTLAKKHFHRLWYPEPGQGGDIASRSWFGITKKEFDERMPGEFWRGVVERISQTVPDTLLLAEAFWLMEGYFVRSLGMHRVYNSAFMNMLSREDNQQYREVIKNTIEFDPEILKRYVNFMNNPDEEPAVIQFGKGDKYFGVCAMMSTLPGLPMFGHGQFEGFTEKYGMEYRRSYWNENPDEGLIAYHERVITPILKHRRLFSGAEHFNLYDFFLPDHSVDENVFAYSNQRDSESALFVYNNSPHSAQGSISMSAARRFKSGDSELELRQSTLADGLSLSGMSHRFVLFFDLIHRRWWIRRSSLLKEHGFQFTLGPYQSHAFINVHEVDEAADCKYEKIERYLQGGGTTSIDSTWYDIQFLPYHQAVRKLTTEIILDAFDAMTQPFAEAGMDDQPVDFDPFESMILDQSTGIADVFGKTELILTAEIFTDCLLDVFEDLLIRILDFRNRFQDQHRVILIWSGLIQKTIRLLQRQGYIDPKADYRIRRVLEKDLMETGFEEVMADAASGLTEFLVATSLVGSPIESGSFFRSKDVITWIQVNRYMDTEYFNRESFEELIEWVRLWGCIPAEILKRMTIDARHCGYRYKEFLDALTSDK